MNRVVKIRNDVYRWGTLPLFRFEKISIFFPQFLKVTNYTSLKSSGEIRNINEDTTFSMERVPASVENTCRGDTSQERLYFPCTWTYFYETWIQILSKVRAFNTRAKHLR